jgi:hypothetical protein
MNPLLTVFSRFDNVHFAQTYVHDLSVKPYEVVNFYRSMYERTNSYEEDNRSKIQSNMLYDCRD